MVELLAALFFLGIVLIVLAAETNPASAGVPGDKTFGDPSRRYLNSPEE